MNNVILFTNAQGGGVGRRLQKAVESVLSNQHMEVLRSIKELSKRLLRIPNEIAVAVLLADSKNQLSELLSLNNLLDDIRIILILPNRDRDTISKGHLLLPRFLSYTDGDFADVGAVLKKMIENLDKNI